MTFGLTGEQGCGGGSCFAKGLAGPQPIGRWAVKLDFVGANPKATVKGEAATSAKISYFKGPKADWKTGLATFGRVVYSDLWPGIDLVYEGDSGKLKGTFVVRPGADPSRIQLAYEGAQKVSLTESGRIHVATPVGDFSEDAPVSYQEIAGKRVEVQTPYILLSPKEGRGEEGLARRVSDAGQPSVYGFRVGAYDVKKTLVIDPVTLIYAGYIGGSGYDSGAGIAVDSTGAAYVAGATTSFEATFPVASGPDLTYNGVFDTDAFVAKVAPDGTALIYAGYIGGADDDGSNSITVDSTGAAYVTGLTHSSEATFPVVVGPDLTHNGYADAFVAKVNSAGTGLIYAGYIGGDSSDHGVDLAVDSTGAAYVAGSTSSSEATLPVVGGPDLTHNGYFDAFVAKVDPSGTALTYAGYIGGDLDDAGYGISVDSAGAVYVTGVTASSEATFPVVGGPDPTFNGGYSDVFVAKVDPSGTALTYAGYIGGADDDYGTGVAVDSTGAAYVTGYTYSSEATFPVVGGPDLTYNSSIYYGDAFVAKVDPSGTALTYAGYIGGARDDYGYSIAVDATGAAYVTGVTESSAATFPVVGGPDLTHNGYSDAFVAKVDPSGTALTYTGYIGGADDDRGTGLAVDTTGAVYVAGGTESSEATFPVVGGPDLTYNGVFDVFVAKIADTTPPSPLETCDGVDNNGDGLVDEGFPDTDGDGIADCVDTTPLGVCLKKTVTIRGTSGNDVMTGTSGADVMDGLDGNDILDGLDGNDILCGSAGDDLLLGGTGRDRLSGGQGDDALDGGADTDNCSGGPGLADTAVACEVISSVP